MKRAARRRGFSLLEVMIAVAIAAVALTALFASEVQAGKVSFVARNTGTATILAQCKMGEIEEQVAKEGLPAIDDRGTDACCEGAEIDGFECEWLIERIELPDNVEEETEEGAAPGGALGGLVGDEGAQTAAIDSALAGTMGGGSDGLAEMAISIAYPVLKPSIEDQVRRATVTVRWNEGRRQVSFDVVQYLVAEQVAVPQDDTGAIGAVPPPGSP